MLIERKTLFARSQHSGNEPFLFVLHWGALSSPDYFLASTGNGLVKVECMAHSSSMKHFSFLLSSRALENHSKVEEGIGGCARFPLPTGVRHEFIFSWCFKITAAIQTVCFHSKCQTSFFRHKVFSIAPVFFKEWNTSLSLSQRSPPVWFRFLHNFPQFSVYSLSILLLVLMMFNAASLHSPP